MDDRVRVRPSARKHDIAPEESIHAASTAVYVAPLDEENPQRELRLGFDTHARLLELVVLIWMTAPRRSSTRCAPASSTSRSSRNPIPPRGRQPRSGRTSGDALGEPPA